MGSITFKGGQTAYKMLIIETYKKLREQLNTIKNKDNTKGLNSIIDYLNKVSEDNYILTAKDASPQDFIQYLKAKNKNINTEVINTFNRYHIKVIWLSYNLLKTYFTFEPEYDKFFLLSSSTRRGLLTRGMIFKGEAERVKAKSNIKNYGFIDVTSMQKEVDDKPSESFEVLINGRYVMVKYPNATTKKIDEVEKDKYYIWYGCHMSLPERTKVTLSFDKLYPTFYIGEMEKNPTTGGNNEVFLEEHPWTVSVIYDKDLHVSYKKETGITTTTTTTTTSESEGTIKKEIITEKTIPDILGDDLFTNQKIVHMVPSIKANGQNVIDFNSFRFKIENIKDYEIILMMPYAPPKADMLVALNINKSNNDDKEEVILSTS